LKKTFAFLLIFCIWLHNFSQTAIVLAFQVNQKYVAEYLCVKRTVKNNCCQGKCYLNKKIADEKAAQKLVDFLKEKAALIYVLVPFFNYQKVVFELSLTFIQAIDSSYYQYYASILHPPS
jgi:hypothetical protein